MPPRKRRTKKDPDSLMAIFEKYAVEAGVDLNVTKQDFEDTGDNDPLARKLEGEALVRRIEYAMETVKKKCQNCGELFETSYYYDGFCTYSCTESYLRKTYGFVYSGSRPVAERWSFQHWRMTPPMKLNPGMLNALEQFARKFLQDLEEFRAAESGNQIEPTQDQRLEDETPTPETPEQDQDPQTDPQTIARPEYPPRHQERVEESANPLSLPDIEFPDIRLSF